MTPVVMNNATRQRKIALGRNAPRGTPTTRSPRSIGSIARGRQGHPVLEPVLLVQRHPHDPASGQIPPALADPALRVGLAGERLVGAVDRPALRVFVPPRPRHATLPE